VGAGLCTTDCDVFLVPFASEFSRQNGAMLDLVLHGTRYTIQNNESGIYTHCNFNVTCFTRHLDCVFIL
jgi:hypothetical protein